MAQDRQPNDWVGTYTGHKLSADLDHIRTKRNLSERRSSSDLADPEREAAAKRGWRGEREEREKEKTLREKSLPTANTPRAGTQKSQGSGGTFQPPRQPRDKCLQTKGRKNVEGREPGRGQSATTRHGTKDARAGHQSRPVRRRSLSTTQVIATKTAPTFPWPADHAGAPYGSAPAERRR